MRVVPARFAGFADRREAGRRLARELRALDISDPVVLALPRGGVPVAVEVALHLGAPIDLLMVRKIGVPWEPEVAAAAVVDGERPDLVLNQDVMRLAGLHREDIEKLMTGQLAEIDRRRKLYMSGRAAVPVSGRSAIVVDDGIATGATVRAALAALRRRGPKRLILAVPVGPEDTLAALSSEVDDVVCLERPSPFYAIGEFYADFHQVGDDEVIALLASVPAAANPGGIAP
jgi:putative phosphoribosyl transferase